MTDDIPNDIPDDELSVPPSDAANEVLDKKDNISLGVLFKKIFKFFGWPWAVEKINSIEGYLNVTECVKILSSLVVSGGGAVTLLEAVGRDADTLIPAQHSDMVPMIKATATFVVAGAGFLTALNRHLKNDTKNKKK